MTEPECDIASCWCKATAWFMPLSAMRWAADDPGQEFPRFEPELEDAA